MKSPNNTSPSPSDNVYINNSHAADHEGDEQQQNEPLFNNSIKMGPFSIRYSPFNKKKKKRYDNNDLDDLVQYEDKREGRELLHDFAMTQSVFDIEDNNDDCDDGNELYESSRRRIPLRIILLGESLYNVCGCGCSIICNEQYIARLLSLLSSLRDVSDIYS